MSGALPSLRMAWRNLWRHRLRTILAALGIVVGVVAIAGLGITGSALRYSATQQFDDVTNRVYIQPGEDAQQEYLSAAQIQTVREMAPQAQVIPVSRGHVSVESHDRTVETLGIEIENPERLYAVDRGRIPDRLDGVLVSNDTAHRLRVEVGDQVIVAERSYEVVGVISQEGYGVARAPIIVPPATLDKRGYDAATVIASDADTAQRIANATEDTFNEDEESVVRVRSNEQVGERVGSLFNTLNLILLGIGSISLFVAGVSILNVMLMSVVERKAEIGVLRSVGVRRFQVLRMVLSEAALLGVLGGVVGAAVALGLGGVLFDQLFDDATLVLRWSSLRFAVIGFVFGVVASGLSGIYPAWRAARQSPVEAIRG